MGDFLDQNIKDVLNSHPGVAAILSGYGIGCVGCSMGSCLIKDIIEIHDLSEDDERALIQKIAAVMHPGVKLSLPARKPRQKSASRKSLSPPVQELVNEHVVIKRFLAQIPRIFETMDLSDGKSRDFLLAGLDFVREYADNFHHAKEERILFGYFDPDSEIIASFLKEHEIGRSHIAAARESLTRKDGTAFRNHLSAYAELLREHIKKEDEILFPWMDRSLSDHQVGQLYSSFAKVSSDHEVAVKKHLLFAETISQP